MNNKSTPFRNRWKSWPILLPALLIIPVLLFAGLLGLVYLGVFGPMPDNSELREIRHHEASTVQSADGNVLGRYYLQNRDRVSLEDVSPEFIDALLAIEDIRFYDHSGLDYRALARVFVKTLLLRQDAGGGSTLSQQLAKNLYPREGRSRLTIGFDKMREIIIAQRLERLYTKKEILEMYVNTISFGEDTWGISTASERFFNRPPDRLELHQSATLAGMLRATTWYNPRRNPGNAIQRRNLVLSQMQRYGMIDSVTADEARSRPLDLDYNRLSQQEGTAPHFRRHLGYHLRHILDTQPALDGNQYNLYTDGLVIVTTIDSRLQDAAEFAVHSNLARLQHIFDNQNEHEPAFKEDDSLVIRTWQNTSHYRSLRDRGYSDEQIREVLDDPVPMDLFTWDGMETVIASPRDSIRHYLSFLNAGFLAIDPADGNIRAWVGGISHNRFQYDHVRSRRQTGSAFKPVVFAAALESGIEPCDYRRNLLSQYVAYDDWTPENLQEEYGGHYSVEAALSRSVNTIAVELMMEVGIEKVRETARKMGIQSHIPAGPSVALGSAELSLLELTRAYTAFTNGGVPAETRFIEAIYNSDGELIYDFSPSLIPDFLQFDFITIPLQTEPAFSEETASALLTMLSKTVEDGTASPLRTEFGITGAVAGKTGTNQGFTDGWFVGITPGLVFGSWVGGVTPQVKLPEQIGYASGNALPIAGNFLQEISRNPDLNPLADQFHPHQINTSFNTACEDYRDERFTDRVRDFFRGRDSQEAQVIEEEDDRSLIDRVKGWFRRDQ